MRRREFISLLGGAAVSCPMAAFAQRELPLVGFLHSGSSGPYSGTSAAFERGLGEAGFVVGRNVEIDFRWADDHFDRLPALASELVRRKVSLIFAGGGDVTALAAKAATENVPIVFAIGADPVTQGIVSSMNRPGGNITGVSFLAVELRPKTLELIRELVPNSRKIAVLGNAQRPNFDRLLREVLEPAQAIGLQVHVLKAGSESEIEAAFASFRDTPVDALLVMSDPVFFNRRRELARLEQRYAVPTFNSSREYVLDGGLISYGASITDAYHQAGVYAGRILKGEKPFDLPVMQPIKFELVINLKTAKVHGVTVPPMLLARADEVIE